MQKYLLIAEKPSLQAAIKDAYNSLPQKPFVADYFALHGHFVELQEPDAYKEEWGKPWRREVLPMIPDSFVYQVKTNCKDDYKKLKEIIQNGAYDALVNCCDAGREGEAIFWSIINSMKISKLPKIKRLWAQDVTIETLGKALMGLLDYDQSIDLRNQRDAALCRMEFDWCVGMNLSRAAMMTTRLRSSVGRVKTPTLNLVVERDLEIQNFKPKDYFEVVAHFDKYDGSWFDPETKATSFDDREKAEALKKSLGKTGVIESIKNEQNVSYAPAPYSLAELQKEANAAFGFTASQTLDLAQSLYETHKILSYPRTESRALSTALAKEIPDLLRALKDIPEVSQQVQMILSDPDRIKKVCGSKKYVDNKKVTDHHAIINTKVTPRLEKLSDNERKLFVLVIKKFVSIFLDPYITNKTTIITDVTGQKFKTVGSMIEALGYKELYRGEKKSKEDEDLIPAVKEKEEVIVRKIDILAKQTKPPESYNDRTLIEAMQHAGKFVEDEKMKELLDDVKGIGTSATRAAIIEDLIKKQFLERRGKSIKAVELGFKTIEALQGKNILSPILTAEWEEKLRQIEGGNISNGDFRSNMTQYLHDETAAFLSISVQGTNSQHFNANKKVIGTCPMCGKAVIMTSKYYMCEAYKKPELGDCPFISGFTILGAKVSETEFKKILSGKATKKLKFVSAKSGKPFEAFLYYDQNVKRIYFRFDDPDET